MKDSVYDFPVNMRAARNTLREQALVAMGEVAEAFAAIENGEGDGRVLEELWDARQAIEGCMRRFPTAQVKVARAAVKVKCRARGDYDG